MILALFFVRQVLWVRWVRWMRWVVLFFVALGIFIVLSPILWAKEVLKLLPPHAIPWAFVIISHNVIEALTDAIADRTFCVRVTPV